MNTHLRRLTISCLLLSLLLTATGLHAQKPQAVPLEPKVEAPDTQIGTLIFTDDTACLLYTSDAADE